MANLPVAVRLNKVPGGVEIITIGRTERGTRFYRDSAVIITDKMNSPETKAIMGTAVEKLLGPDYPTR